MWGYLPDLDYKLIVYVNIVEHLYILMGKTSALHVHPSKLIEVYLDGWYFNESIAVAYTFLGQRVRERNIPFLVGWFPSYIIHFQGWVSNFPHKGDHQWINFMVLGVKLMMVIGHGIGLEKVTTLLNIAVVGKFQFKVGNHDDLLKWVDDN